MADIGEQYKTHGSYPKSHKKKETMIKKAKPSRNNFKANVSKKSRQEWGERMQHLRSIQ